LDACESNYKKLLRAVVSRKGLGRIQSPLDTLELKEDTSGRRKVSSSRVMNEVLHNKLQLRIINEVLLYRDGK